LSALGDPSGELVPWTKVEADFTVVGPDGTFDERAAFAPRLDVSAGKRGVVGVRFHADDTRVGIETSVVRDCQADVGSKVPHNPWGHRRAGRCVQVVDEGLHGDVRIGRSTS
jgi:hypothetical protein